MKNNRHRIILIGGDHYNGLSLVRIFGRQGIRPCGIIIGKEADRGFLRTSRYWKKVYTTRSNDEIMDILRRNFCGSKKKPVLLPYSDAAAAVLDQNYEELQKSFILPGLGGRQGEIYRMMDKGRQVQFAKECGFPMAQSYELALPAEELPEDLLYPCIVKPIVSCEGSKKDIRKLGDAASLKSYLQELSARGYSRILVQEYLQIDAEYDIEGFLHGDSTTYFVSEKVRTWPEVGGPTCYAFSVRNEALNAEMDKILHRLRELNFSGLFDIEIFRVGGRFVFNEFNWRNSAVCFAAAASGVLYPYYWYCAVTGTPYEIHEPDQYGVYSMNERLDLHYVLRGKISPAAWYAQYKACGAYAYRDREDPKPARAKTMLLFTRRFHRG